LRDLAGFGKRSEEKLIAGIERLRTSGERVLYPEAAEEADRLLAMVRAVPGVEHAEIAGSVRRRRETIGDIDVVCAAPAEAAGVVIERFVSYPGVVGVVGRGETKTSGQLT